jgi:hypothetical protein
MRAPDLFGAVAFMYPAPMKTFAPTPANRIVATIFGVVMSLVLTGLTFFTASIFWASRSIHYTVNDSSLRVEIHAGFLMSTTRTMSLPADPSESLSIKQMPLRTLRRTNGTRMANFCVGSFEFGDIGNAWTAGNCTRDVVVITPSATSKVTDNDTRPWVLTPPDPNGFISALVHHTHLSVDAPQWEVDTVSQWFALVPLFLIAIDLLLVALVFGAGRLRYSIDGGTLIVQRALSEIRFDLRGAAVDPFQPDRVIRAFGTAYPGYYAGKFWLNGTVTSLYASTLRTRGALILLRDGRQVYVSPEDVAGFVDAVKHAAG